MRTLAAARRDEVASLPLRGLIAGLPTHEEIGTRRSQRVAFFHCADPGGNGRIEPARRTLLTRFAIAERHVAPIVVNSPFIPAGRVEMMAVGIARMIQGDYLTACHLLYPQLENILRHILVTHGEDPSKIEPDLLQGDRALGALLNVDRPRLTEILGEDAVHLIDIVFNFRPDTSLRNELAHGKLGWGAFHSPYAIYGCWFILWLVALPLRRYWKGEVAPLIESAV